MQNCNRKKIHCAICSQPGTLECKYCHHVTYCSEKHRYIDWNAIHQDICSNLKQLQKPIPVFVTDIERQQHKEKLISTRQHVLNVCEENGKKLLSQKNYKHALPVIMQELRWISEIFSPSSAEIIPTYCRIIEACLGNGRLEQAEDYMSQALWCLQKGETTNAVKFSLFKVFGRICEAKEQVEESRDALAEHLFYAAEEWGPESIQTMWGYLHLGVSFLEKPAAAYSFFSKVIKVEYEHLMPIVNAYFDKKEIEEFAYVIEEGSHSLPEQLEMMINVRSYMENMCKKYITINEITTLFLTLGILHHLCATDKAVAYLEQVIEVAEKNKHFDSTLSMAKKLLTKEQLRLKEWLRNKMTDALIWEGLPGTWHDIDACCASSKESHSEMMKYYNIIDDRNNQAKKEVKTLAGKAKHDIKIMEKRQTAGKDAKSKSDKIKMEAAAEVDEDNVEESSDEDAVQTVGMPSRSLSGSAKTPVSLYYLSYIK